MKRSLVKLENIKLCYTLGVSIISDVVSCCISFVSVTGFSLLLPLL
jgi:hypothetical protein